MSKKNTRSDNDNNEDDCEFFAVTECPCGRTVALCIRHGGVFHEKPYCQEYRDMERGPYLDYVSREMAKTLFTEAEDSESWPRA